MAKKYESGAVKRKLAKERDERVNKLPKITSFFTSQSDNVSHTSCSESETAGELTAENCFTENQLDTADTQSNAGKSHMICKKKKG